MDGGGGGGGGGSEMVLEAAEDGGAAALLAMIPTASTTAARPGAAGAREGAEHGKKKRKSREAEAAALLDPPRQVMRDRCSDKKVRPHTATSSSACATVGAPRGVAAHRRFRVVEARVQRGDDGAAVRRHQVVRQHRGCVERWSAVQQILRLGAERVRHRSRSRRAGTSVGGGGGVGLQQKSPKRGGHRR